MRGRDAANCIAERKVETSQLENFQAAAASAGVSESIQYSDTYFTIEHPPLSPCVCKKMTITE